MLVHACACACVCVCARARTYACVPRWPQWPHVRLYSSESGLLAELAAADLPASMADEKRRRAAAACRRVAAVAAGLRLPPRVPRATRTGRLTATPSGGTGARRRGRGGGRGPLGACGDRIRARGRIRVCGVAVSVSQRERAPMNGWDPGLSLRCGCDCPPRDPCLAPTGSQSESQRDLHGLARACARADAEL